MKIVVLGSKSARDLVLAKRAELEITGHSVCGLAFDTDVPVAEEPQERQRHSLDEPASGGGHKEQRAASLYRARAAAEARKSNASEKQKIYAQISSADCVLVVNSEKDGVPGYIGSSVLMELAVAHCLGKPILLLSPLPSAEEHRWVHDVEVLNPTVLNGSLKSLPVMGSLQWAGLG